METGKTGYLHRFLPVFLLLLTQLPTYIYSIFLYYPGTDL